MHPLLAQTGAQNGFSWGANFDFSGKTTNENDKNCVVGCYRNYAIRSISEGKYIHFIK